MKSFILSLGEIKNNALKYMQMLIETIMNMLQGGTFADFEILNIKRNFEGFVWKIIFFKILSFYYNQEDLKSKGNKNSIVAILI